VEKLNQEYATYLNLCLRMKSGSNGKLMFNDFMVASEKLNQSVNNIYDVNIQAVVRKTELTKHDSARFKNSMVLIGVICIILALGYCWYFPVYISTTISYLSERMKNLIKESGMTMDINTNDEAQIILQSINLLENKLGIKK
jgi:anaerobic C4-dicarboxylate transporter